MKQSAECFWTPLVKGCEKGLKESKNQMLVKKKLLHISMMPGWRLRALHLWTWTFNQILKKELKNFHLRLALSLCMCKCICTYLNSKLIILDCSTYGSVTCLGVAISKHEQGNYTEPCSHRCSKLWFIASSLPNVIITPFLFKVGFFPGAGVKDRVGAYDPWVYELVNSCCFLSKYLGCAVFLPASF